MDRLAAMEVFVRVVERGSFTKAAESLRLSRAMVSKHVQDLEDHVQTRLLTRTTRRVALTELGQEFYQRCTRLLADLAEAEHLTSHMNRQPRGLLRISAPVSFGISHLAAAVSDYSSQYPQVRVDVSLNDRFVDLIAEGFDLAIRIGNLPDSGLIARILAPCHMVLCAAPSYLSRRGRPQCPADLSAHNCLPYTLGHSREWKFQVGDRIQSLPVQGNLHSNNGDVLRMAALSGQGIILQPSFIVGGDIAAGRLKALLTDTPPVGLQIHALYPPGRYLSAKVRTFVDFMAARFGPSPAWDSWRNTD